ncbi:MAG: nucleotidyl transferase AbiEii/AbiGii toxin family protein [Gammaproteobacteria bacterium]|nr:nucleotidyl transferase AbiEii/AbiGii toxin family protein [Gammaproteobacteria bacterium]
MPDSQIKVDVVAWVEQVRADSTAYRQRQGVAIILNAIAAKSPLNHKMFLKGGILMGLAYDSPRQTVDIDLTTSLKAESNVGEWIREQLNEEMPSVADRLGYDELVTAVQSAKWQRGGFPDAAEFPALRLKVGYALRGTNQEKALKRGRAAEVIGIDISFNERLGHIQILAITGGQELFAYGLADLIAEKYRAVLQQVTRNRNRQQDIFDLDLLISGNEINEKLRTQILEIFIEKCRSRNLEPAQTSLDVPEVKERSGAKWETMELEVGETPDFEGCYMRVSEFYESLPWDGFA